MTDPLDTPQPGAPFGSFFYFLYCADGASRVVDNFDLHSENPESKAEFDRLCVEQSDACIKLVRFCAEHHEALVAAFEGEMLE